MFLDKRDEKGQLLSFKAFAISEEVAELGIKNFKQTEIFKELKNLFSEKYLILLFKKLIFESVYETSCKALLSKYNKDKVIDTDFYSINLLKDNKHFSDCILINKSKKINLNNTKKFLIDFFWEQYSIIADSSTAYLLEEDWDTNLHLSHHNVRDWLVGFSNPSLSSRHLGCTAAVHV